MVDSDFSKTTFLILKTNTRKKTARLKIYRIKILFDAKVKRYCRYVYEYGKPIIDHTKQLSPFEKQKKFEPLRRRRNKNKQK
jgi:hypothetical protein